MRFNLSRLVLVSILTSAGCMGASGGDPAGTGGSGGGAGGSGGSRGGSSGGTGGSATGGSGGATGGTGGTATGGSGSATGGTGGSATAGTGGAGGRRTGGSSAADASTGGTSGTGSDATASDSGGPSSDAPSTPPRDAGPINVEGPIPPYEGPPVGPEVTMDCPGDPDGRVHRVQGHFPGRAPLRPADLGPLQHRERHLQLLGHARGQEAQPHQHRPQPAHRGPLVTELADRRPDVQRRHLLGKVRQQGDGGDAGPHHHDRHRPRLHGRERDNVSPIPARRSRAACSIAGST